MPFNDQLGARMKHNYEEVAKYRLTRRTPVAIRLDGRAFHTFTKRFQKPFDPVLHKAMVRTMSYLLENIQGAKFGYTQSDEITIILTDYDNLETSAWFDYEIQKLCSISASMATLTFNKFFAEETTNWWKNAIDSGTTKENTPFLDIYAFAVNTGAMFDSRCFNIPKEEVANLVVWRWMDAKRNSIQMVGQANFSHKKLQNKSCADIREMLQSCDPWEDYGDNYRYGVMGFKNSYNEWIIKPAYNNYIGLREMVNYTIGYKEEN